MSRNQNKQLIIPLILSIVSLVYIFMMCVFVFEYEQYIATSTTQYYEIFQITFFCLALSTMYLLVKANKSKMTGWKNNFLSILSLVLLIVSVCMLLQCYQTNIQANDQFNITKIIFGEYLISKSIVSHSKRELHLLFELFSIAFIIIVFVILLSYIFEKMENKNEKLEEKKIFFEKISSNFSSLSLGFEYKTIP